MPALIFRTRKMEKPSRSEKHKIYSYLSLKWNHIVGRQFIFAWKDQSQYARQVKPQSEKISLFGCIRIWQWTLSNLMDPLRLNEMFLLFICAFNIIKFKYYNGYFKWVWWITQNNFKGNFKDCTLNISSSIAKRRYVSRFIFHHLWKFFCERWKCKK